MKFVLLLACVYAASGGSHSHTVPFEDQQMMELDPPMTRAQFSENAKTQLREAAKLAIQELCLNENADPLILDTICRKALSRSLTSTYSAPSLYTCMDCEVADPVCFDSCPQ